jgi:hypothetical protein
MDIDLSTVVITERHRNHDDYPTSGAPPPAPHAIMARAFARAIG